MNDIQKQIRQFVIDSFLFGEDSDTLRIESSFTEDGIIDSTGVLELIVYLEETFGIAIEDDEMTLANLDSIEKAASFAMRKNGTLTV